MYFSICQIIMCRLIYNCVGWFCTHFQLSSLLFCDTEATCTTDSLPDISLWLLLGAVDPLTKKCLLIIWNLRRIGKIKLFPLVFKSCSCYLQEPTLSKFVDLACNLLVTYSFKTAVCLKNKAIKKQKTVVFS